MKKSKKQRHEDMISINFYPEEIEMLIRFLGYAMAFCEKKGWENYKKAEQQQRNLKLILKVSNEKKIK